VDQLQQQSERVIPNVAEEAYHGVYEVRSHGKTQVKTVHLLRQMVLNFVPLGLSCSYSSLDGVLKVRGF
jgi:hypothetical protein